MHDVIVIGGGPGGLMAARRLAERGRDVVVLEEHAVIGYPVHCTGLIGLNAFAELELPRETIRATVRSACFRANGHSVLFHTDRIAAAVVDRGSFDAALARGAVLAGASIRTGVRVDRIDVGSKNVEIHTGDRDRPIRGRACVLACGAKYRLHRSLGLGIPRAWIQSVQFDAPFPPYPHVEVHLGRELAPGGFAWLVPFAADGASRARIGVMCQDRAHERFRRFVTALARRSALDVAALPVPQRKMLPLGPIRKTYATRVVAVGDAAGLVKPTTGGGIYYSLLTGRLAADVLDDALGRDALGDAHLREYQARWKELLGAEIRIGLAFRALTSKLDDGVIQRLLRLSSTDGVQPLLSSNANFNWHRQTALALMRNASFRRVILASVLS